MSNIFGIKNLPYKMVKMYDTSRKGSFMLQGQMTKNVRKKGKFSIILKEDDSNQCSYEFCFSHRLHLMTANQKFSSRSLYRGQKALNLSDSVLPRLFQLF